MASRSLLLAAAILVVPASALLVSSNSTAATQACPSTSFYFSTGDDAAGTPVWQGPLSPPDGQCLPACATAKNGGVLRLKFCGPGTLHISRMSCNQHHYKKVTFKHSKEQYTISDCEEISTKDYYQINEKIQSIWYECPTTAR